ncbi:transmembrane protein 171 isoform X1 [Rhinatrema bivittatum]|uniref:transmembrane protein 171 isoform X1 n=1 Tax=Rhinatrema bivittatum TaxID=194408 RepID=UPI00112E0330|nr:transmembrane protein 171 isoform X1 [Rhinatrema bivittatum]XP_029430628.1 transmembrane protein 171 isoform X1 [Rhinatrema bivittatum]XP_029430637.1 transmembrane protein 171 isoform X1 [Rhinatrema bivittatum]XP_029430645.1 transmembrane protein 171 isoform X1 [Rhinatrema bivittatum]
MQENNLLVMNPFAVSPSFWSRSSGCTSKFIFFLFVFGVVLFCSGILLSIFGFQACQSESLTSCNVALKVVGPSLAVIGLGSVLLARSRARLFVSQRQLQCDQVDPDSIFLCGESRQFAQFLIFGFLFLTSGILISILGVWVPGCNTQWQNQQFNSSSSSSVDLKGCGLLSLQIMGPLIVLVGLCFFVVAYIKKKHRQDSLQDEELQPQIQEPFHITVGDAVIIFPPPPPPYFADSGACNGANGLPVHENPPPYSTIFNNGDHLDVPGSAGIRGQQHIYTISVPSSPPEPPPKYEEKASSSNSYSSSLPSTSRTRN